MNVAHVTAHWLKREGTSVSILLFRVRIPVVMDACVRFCPLLNAMIVKLKQNLIENKKCGEKKQHHNEWFIIN